MKIERTECRGLISDFSQDGRDFKDFNWNIDQAVFKTKWIYIFIKNKTKFTSAKRTYIVQL